MTFRIKKIDDNGLYCKFPGVTVIANVTDNDICQQIQHFIANDEIIRRYFSPLPAGSLHMTVFDLYTEKYLGNNHWENFIAEKKDFFENLSSSLRSQSSSTVLVKTINSFGTIELVVAVLEEQKKAIGEIANKFSENQLAEKIPSEFHITLAYQYEPYAGPEMSSVNERITENLNNILQQCDLQLKLTPPQLCYFNDMTAFFPWDGKSNPFPLLSHQCSPLSTSGVFGNKASKGKDSESAYKNDDQKGCTIL